MARPAAAPGAARPTEEALFPPTALPGDEDAPFSVLVATDGGETRGAVETPARDSIETNEDTDADGDPPLEDADSTEDLVAFNEADEAGETVEDTLGSGDAVALLDAVSDASADSDATLVTLGPLLALGERDSRLDAEALRERGGDADDDADARLDKVPREVCVDTLLRDANALRVDSGELVAESVATPVAEALGLLLAAGERVSVAGCVDEAVADGDRDGVEVGEPREESDAGGVADADRLGVAVPQDDADVHSDALAHTVLERVSAEDLDTVSGAEGDDEGSAEADTESV